MPRVIQTRGINSAVDAGASAAFIASFRMYEQNDLFAEIGTIERTQKGEARIPFLWYPPRMREWVGERLIGSLDGGMHIIPTRTYEASVAVPRTAVEDDQYGAIERAARGLASEFFRFVHQSYINILQNGGALNTFDGLPLLTNNPNTRGANNVNLVQQPLSLENLSEGIQAMGLYTEPDGRPLGMRPTHLLVGPANEFTAKNLVQSQQLIRSGSTDRVMGEANPWAGSMTVLVSNYITGNDWYLIAAGANEYRPAIMVERTDVGVEFAAHTSPDHESVFRRDSYEYGTRARVGFGAGAWYAVYASQV
jgi:phage major head subunit gpT-like protein